MTFSCKGRGWHGSNLPWGAGRWGAKRATDQALAQGRDLEPGLCQLQRSVGLPSDACKQGAARLAIGLGLECLERIEPSNAEPRVVADIPGDDREILLEGGGGDEEVFDGFARLTMLKSRPSTTDRTCQRKY